MSNPPLLLYMTTPDKYIIALYIFYHNKSSFKSLVKSLKNNIYYEKLNEKSAHKYIHNLILKKWVIKTKNKEYQINLENKDCKATLAFIIWCRKESIDYSILLKDSIRFLVSTIVEKHTSTLGELEKATTLSKTTLRKYIYLLEKNRVISIEKKKPLTLSFSLNDVTLFYLNLLESIHLKKWQSLFSKEINKFNRHKNKKRDEKLINQLINLHVYSSTVTEGNTATQEEVDLITRNFATSLTPKEIVEVINTRKAVEYLFSTVGQYFSLDYIYTVHNLVLEGLSSHRGTIFASSKKRIIGSSLKLLSSQQDIELALEAMLMFLRKYDNIISPSLLGALLHFWFVTIHPFADGNGRVTRLVHSKLLLEHKLPLFIFDPNDKYVYFEALETGRKHNVSDITRFLLEKHCVMLDTVE